MLWFRTKANYCKKQGGRQLVRDVCLYVWHEQGVLVGMLVWHVDDFLASGTQKFLTTVVTNICNNFGIRDLKRGSFRFCGMNFTQTDNKKRITLDQQHYTEMIELINEGPAKGLLPSTLLPQHLITVIQQVVGIVLWLAVNTRPDLGFDVSHLAGDYTMGGLSKANKLIRRAKADSTAKLVFEQIGNGTLMDLDVMNYSDGGLGGVGKDNTKSQQGQMYFLVKKNTNPNTVEKAKANPSHHRSGRIRRVTHASLTSETLAATEALGLGIYFVEHLEDWVMNRQPVRFRQCNTQSLGFEQSHAKFDQERQNLTFGYVQVHDSDSLLRHLESTISAPQEKRLAIEMDALREAKEVGQVKQYCWIDTILMLADELAKSENRRRILAFMQTNMLQFVVKDNPKTEDKERLKRLGLTWREVGLEKETEKQRQSAFVSRILKVARGLNLGFRHEVSSSVLDVLREHGGNRRGATAAPNEPTYELFEDHDDNDNDDGPLQGEGVQDRGHRGDLPERDSQQDELGARGARESDGEPDDAAGQVDAEGPGGTEDLHVREGVRGEAGDGHADQVVRDAADGHQLGGADLHPRGAGHVGFLVQASMGRSRWNGGRRGVDHSRRWATRAAKRTAGTASSDAGVSAASLEPPAVQREADGADADLDEPTDAEEEHAYDVPQPSSERTDDDADYGRDPDAHDQRAPSERRADGVSGGLRSRLSRALAGVLNTKAKLQKSRATESSIELPHT